MTNSPNTECCEKCSGRAILDAYLGNGFDCRNNICSCHATPSNEVVGEFREKHAKLAIILNGYDEVAQFITPLGSEGKIQLALRYPESFFEELETLLLSHGQSEYLRGRGERESELLVEISTMMVERAENADYKGLNALTDVLALLNRSTPPLV